MKKESIEIDRYIRQDGSNNGFFGGCDYKQKALDTLVEWSKNGNKVYDWTIRIDKKPTGEIVKEIAVWDITMQKKDPVPYEFQICEFIVYLDVYWQ